MITLSKSKLLKFAELSELQIDGRSEFAYTNRLEHFAELVLSDLDVCMEHVPENEEHRQQLAAEQLNNKLLRDALNQWIGIAANCSIESGCCGCGEPIENHSHPMMCGHSPVDMAYSVVREAIDSTDKALSIPASTEALDKYVAEKVKELEAELTAAYKSIDDNWTSHQKIVEANRQRDLAVEALKSCGVNYGLNGPTQYFDEDLVERAIKESEAK